MLNTFLKDKTSREIDALIERIIKDIGNPEPPLSLEVIRDRLKLHKDYYSATEVGALQETTHCLIMAGKQIIERPLLLWEAVKKCDLKALFLPDTKRILIDSSLAPLKQRWAEGHEISHDIIPWHEKIMHGDQQQTLRFDCHLQMESEANFATGRLLFLRDRFQDELRSSPINFENVRKLSDRFGNTITSSLWRTVEVLDYPAVGLVSVHPWKRLDPMVPVQTVRYFIRSLPFSQQFGNITEGEVYRKLAKVVTRKGNGPLGKKVLEVPDINGESHLFAFECFANGYDTLSIGLYQGKKTLGSPL